MFQASLENRHKEKDLQPVKRKEKDYILYG